ncbi:MAG: hypothetical protein IT459_16590 [Planctomycetes bacterium]|nr:hypothetical protein [Planctomycetota bacterium]
MTIEQPKVVDIVAARPDSRVVKLVISDHLNWSDFDGHARMLQVKVNTYLAFIDAEEFRNLVSPKLPDEPEFEIVLASHQPPTPEAETLFQHLADALKGYGIGFTVKRFDGGPHDS